MLRTRKTPANADRIHAANEDGQHDEMPTRTDCPACQPAAYQRPALAVRYCDPSTCADPRCGNYRQPAEGGAL